MSKKQGQKPKTYKKYVPPIRNILQPKRMVFTSPESITEESCSSQENIKPQERPTLNEVLEPFQPFYHGSKSLLQRMKPNDLPKEEQKLEEPIQINAGSKKNDKASFPKLRYKQVDGKLRLITPDRVINKDEVLEPDEERPSFFEESGTISLKEKQKH